MSSGYVYWLEHWIHWLKNIDWKTLGGSKVDSAFHFLETDQMSTRNSSGLCVVKSKVFPRIGYVLEAMKDFFFNNGNNIQSLEPHQSLNTEKIWHMFYLNCWFVTKRKINDFFGDRIL